MSLPLSAPPSAAAWLAQFNGYQRAYAHPSAPAEQLEQLRAAGVPVQLDPIAPRGELVLLKDPLPLTAGRLGKRGMSEAALLALAREFMALGPDEEPRPRLHRPRGPSLLFDAHGQRLELAPMPLDDASSDFGSAIKRLWSQASVSDEFYGVDRGIRPLRLLGLRNPLPALPALGPGILTSAWDGLLSRGELETVMKTRNTTSAAKIVWGSTLPSLLETPGYQQALEREMAESYRYQWRLVNFTQVSLEAPVLPPTPEALAEASDPSTDPARLVTFSGFDWHPEVRRRARVNPGFPGDQLRPLLAHGDPWAWLNPTAVLEGLKLRVAELEMGVWQLLCDLLRWWPRPGLWPGDPTGLGLAALVRRARWSTARARVVVRGLTPEQGRQLVEVLAGVVAE